MCRTGVVLVRIRVTRLSLRVIQIEQNLILGTFFSPANIFPYAEWGQLVFCSHFLLPELLKIMVGRLLALLSAVIKPKASKGTEITVAYVSSHQLQDMGL